MSGLSFDKVLDKVSSELEDSLVFAGALDNNAKLLGFRKGSSKMALPVERHETLDVQISLLFSLLHQLEDIAGMHKFTVTRFGKYNIFLFGTNDIHLFIVSNPGYDENISQVMSQILEPNGEVTPVPSKPGRTEPVAKPAVSALPAKSSTPEHSRADAKVASKSRVTSPSTRFDSSAIAMLQGYLMGTEADLVIDEDSEGFRIRSTGEKGSKVPWALVERINSSFGDKIEITSIDTDRDGTPVVRISPKE